MSMLMYDTSATIYSHPYDHFFFFFVGGGGGGGGWRSPTYSNLEPIYVKIKLVNTKKLPFN